MSDENNDGRNGDGQGGGRAPMTLKPRPQVNTGTVKQSFSHGRTKTVVVETKRRVNRPGEGAPSVGAGAGPRPAAPLPQTAAPRPAPSAVGSRPLGAERTLSDGELAARARVLEQADQRRQAEIAQQRAVEDSRRRDQDAQREAAAREAAANAPPPPPPPVAPPAPEPVRAAEPAPALPTPQPARSPEPVAAAPEAAPVRSVEPAPVAPPAPLTPAPAPIPAAAPVEERPAEPRTWERLSRQNAPRREERSRPEVERDAPPPRPAAPPVQRAEAGAYARSPGAGAPANRSGFGAPRPGGYPDRPRPDAGGGARPTSNYGGDRPREGAGAGYGARPSGGGGGGFGAPRPGGYPDRPRPDAGSSGGYPPRAPRPEGGGYGDRGPRPPREGEGGGAGTVRYSALAPTRPTGPRPSSGGAARPGGFSRPAAAPSAPEFTKTARAGAPRAGERRPGSDDDDSRRKAGANALKAVSRTKGEPVRRQGRLTIQGVGDEDTAEKMRSLASVRRAREREREKRLGGGAAEQGRGVREVVVPDNITVQDLAQRMAIRAVDVIKTLMRQGTMLKITDVLDADTAELIAHEFGMEVRRVSEADVEEGFLSADDDADAGFPKRPPVVAVMGHVDHGKTSLLDALRSADVAAGEHGGITQHIGAYQVRLADGERVTFLDTPGHAAFSQMRARGANVTDIVILVVAADDGVMPQTIEAIHHAKAAGAPIIVAINKIDKPDADPTKVINELLQHEIVIESLGGDTQAIEVSATQKLGLDDLIEAILLQAEVMDLRANPDRSAEGVVIEAKLDKGRGPVATVLVNRGTLKRGDIIVAGSSYGRVRALVNERGEQVPSAGPSEPIEILGLDEAPSPGDALAVVDDEARARELTDYRERVRREKASGPVGGTSLADMMAKLQGKKVSELAVIIKADVQGSAEAITTALEKLSTDEVKARILLSGAGAITESDVLLAKGSGAPILGFNVRASAQARALATREGVELRYYAIIYDLIDDIKAVMSGMLSPLLRETFLGNAEVLQVFDISKIGKIAGCRVTEGVVRRGARTRIIRADVVVQEMGTLQTLKRFKDEVPEVTAGQECGLHFQGFQDLKEGDLIECFTVETVQRSL